MMKIRFLTFSLGLLVVFIIKGQSLELMPGTERVFVDAQWLTFFDQGHKWTLFSRSRATADNEENTNLFTGAYLNYTTGSGLGGTLVGRISNLGSGGDLGVHFFKAKDGLMLYALGSLALSSELSYSWFSIFRFMPPLSENWDIYSSLELFSSFNREGHEASVQRIRLGLMRNGYQFGLGFNLSGLGRHYSPTDSNPGLFLRKQF